MAKRRVTILGATGSVGGNAARVISESDGSLRVEAVTADSSAGELARRAVELAARHAVVSNPAALPELRAALAGTGISAAAGPEALAEAAARPVDVVLSAIVGAAGVLPTAAAASAGNAIALANKECLVCAGGPFMALAAKRGVDVLPVDSEHNALHQILAGKDIEDVERLTLTASGGPFRDWSGERLSRATPEEALRHPTWAMGPKITVDSATMMNKGLELIEAHYLFGVEAEKLQVLVHPQSAVHGIVTFRDGSMHAEMGAADMCRPIAYCLNWPDRPRRNRADLDLARLGVLSFEEPDLSRFPALGLARDALMEGRGSPTVVNAANEIAVTAFLRNRIAFTSIAEIVDNTWQRIAKAGHMAEPASIEEALALDTLSRDIAADGISARHRVAG